MKNKKFCSRFMKKVLLDCVRTEIMASVLYVVILVTGYIAVYNITWQPSPVYYFLKGVQSFSTLLIPFVWLIIILVIIFLYWKKTAGYLEDITIASSMLIQADDEPIKLPVELVDIEDSMNLIKRTAMKNAREAKEAEQRKNDLVVNLAHDIRTPLASIIGYLNLLDEAGGMPAEQRIKYIGITLEKSYRLEALINEFFEITRFNLSTIVLNKGKINLSFMLQQMADEFYPMLSPQGKSAVVDAPGELVLWGDADKLSRVFNNILKNALAYSYKDSVITITAFQQAENTVIQFVNSGDPIPLQKLETIFERFFRLDTSRSSQTGGAGLGLAIAKEIVTAHQGVIKAESDEKETKFTVILPTGKTT